MRSAFAVIVLVVGDVGGGIGGGAARALRLSLALDAVFTCQSLALAIALTAFDIARITLAFYVLQHCEMRGALLHERLNGIDLVITEGN